MTPGTILFDSEYPFTDGSTKPKYMVILNFGSEYPYIAAKTTSKQKSRSALAGCQNSDYFQNFFIPKSEGLMPLDTWIQLEQYRELSTTDLLERKSRGLISHHGTIDGSMLFDLLLCAIDSEDLSFGQEKELKSVLHTIRC